MSGVYIKGMQMPERWKSCASCQFVFTGGVNWATCQFIRGPLRRTGDDGKLPDCPIHPLRGHGRLIDADALLALCPELKEYLDTMAPTVIPADEEP